MDLKETFIAVARALRGGDDSAYEPLIDLIEDCRHMIPKKTINVHFNKKILCCDCRRDLFRLRTCSSIKSLSDGYGWI